MTNTQYLNEFVGILNAQPEPVRLLLKKYNYEIVGNPTLEDVKKVWEKSPKVLEEVFMLAAPITEVNEKVSYADGWVTYAAAGAAALSAIFSSIGGKSDEDEDEEAEKEEQEAEEKEAAAREKRNTYILIGVVVVVIGIVLAVVLSKKK
jgi:hypothetical protein